MVAIGKLFLKIFQKSLQIGKIFVTLHRLNRKHSELEEFGRPREPHKLEIIGSNPILATRYNKTQIHQNLG